MKNHITSKFITGTYHGYNVKFSPFRQNQLACASSENYGIAGLGRLYVIDTDTNEGCKIITMREWSDGLFDVTWSECDPHLLVTSCGDGSIQLWDCMTTFEPKQFYKIHEKEVYSVDWNPKNAYSYILSASWDTTIKLWNPYVAREVAAFREHTDQIYEAKWCPHYPEIFASVSGDASLKLWDIRYPNRCTGVYMHDMEVLSCDWCKSDPKVLASATTDGKIFGWDMRKARYPLFILSGHEYAVRRLKFSPFEPGVLASVSYDFTTRFWNWMEPSPLQVHKEHKEFVYGLDYNPLIPGQACDCAWDSEIHIYNTVQ
ncbi:peroxisomal targeting signal 2 receptor-like [Uloborus diversus]|uniref:peroxisomal targeting signal 2 receptor-like n=1 Tax=Uloborus diversus TaxID=327109 RepID=UPI00240943AA|nr:peroxisomal targeting signal 2 receptor-like [Uloborus diversus]